MVPAGAATRHRGKIIAARSEDRLFEAVFGQDPVGNSVVLVDLFSTFAGFKMPTFFTVLKGNE